MPALDVFATDPGFDVISLTDAINKQPLFPQKIAMMGLFEETGVATLSIMIEEFNGTLYLVSSAPRGGVAQQNVRDGRTVRNLAIPHLPVEDKIMADEVQDVKAFGSETETQVVETIVNQRLNKMSQQLDLTLEWHRIGALKGIVLDSDGTTVLYNLFTEFGVTQETEIDFDLDNATPAAGAVRQLCHQVRRLIRTNLGGTFEPEIHAMCGSTFWDQLISHPEVTTAYERAIAMQDLQGVGVSGAGGFLRAGLVDTSFMYAGIRFWEYSHEIGSETEVATAATRAHFYPVGIPGLFVTRFAPANYMETVNTMGRPKYAKQAIDPRFQKFVDLEAQSNPVNLCTRPKVLIQGKNT